MKKLFALSFFLFSFCFCIKAQPLYLHWTKFFGSLGSDRAFDAVLTSDSSVVFVGSTTDISGLYDFPASPPDSTSFSRNLVIGKIDTNKQLVWSKIYRGSRAESGRCIQLLSDGGFIVLGGTESYDGHITSNHGQSDIWLIRLDSLGNLLWEKTYGSSLSESPISVIQTSDGGFLFFGTSNGSDGDVPSHYGGIFSLDLFVVKTDLVGNIQWTKTLGGSGDEGNAGGLLEADNSFFVISSSTSYDHDCSDTSWRQGSHSDPDFYMFRLDTSGNLLWSKSYGGSDYDNAVNVIWDARDSSIVINGSTQSNDYMVQNWNPGNVDNIWLVKTHIDGALVWASTLADTNAPTLSSTVLLYDNGGYILTGDCYAGFPVKPGRVGSYDTQVFLVDSFGNSYYHKVFGGVFSESGSRILLPYKSGYVIVGESLSEQFTEGVNLNMNHTVNNGSDICITGLLPYPDPLSIALKRPEIKRLGVFPNPAKDLVRVQLPDTIGTLTVTSSAGGKIFTTEHKGSNELSINTANWPAGLYTIRWMNKKGETYSAKLSNN